MMFVDLKKQYNTISKEIKKSIHKVLESGVYINGQNLKTFEKAFANYIGLKYCVGVANGTDALELAIEALSLPKGSEIILPVNSYISSASSVIRAGHKVVFCDANPHDFTINIDSLISKINSNTSAIITVHLYGNPCNMDEISKIKKKYSLKVIEDCAQSHSSTYKNKKTGSFGDLATFSFYPTKPLGAYGDAGCVVSDNASLIKKIRTIINHGSNKKYIHEYIGRNSRLDEIQAAILNTKLKYLEYWTELRKSNFILYYNNLKNNNLIKFITTNSLNKSSFHILAIIVPNKKLLLNEFKKYNIPYMAHYPFLINKSKAFAQHRQKTELFKIEKVVKQIVSLPFHEFINEKEITKVCKIINSVFS